MTSHSSTENVRPGVRSLVRIGAVLLVAAGVFWLVLAITVASVVKRQNADLALSWWPWDSDAQALVAYRLVTSETTPQARARALELSRSALARSPVNVAAARTLGFVTGLAGDEEMSERWLVHGQSLSRRDVPVQLALLELEVRRDNIPAVLRHYDRALRVSSDTHQTLLPILVGASADPAVTRALLPVLERGPLWRNAFAEHLALGTNPATMATIIPYLGLDRGDDWQRSLIQSLLRRMVQQGGYEQAFGAYRQFVADASPGIRNGDFESEDPGLQPFDWQLATDSNLGAFREPREGHGTVLSLIAANARGGDVARQLVLLSPGRYVLSATGGDVAGDAITRPALALTCAGEDGARLTELILPTADASGASASRAFAVPAVACRAQWLSVTARSGLDGGRSAPWVDSISVRPN